MSICESLLVFFAVFSVVMSVCCWVLDQKLYDRNQYIKRSENEVDFIRQQDPELWKQVVNLLLNRPRDHTR